MKDLPMSVNFIQTNSINSSSNTVEPVSVSDGWGVYGNQQTWADLHLR
jgi:hypothetical protein